MKTINAVTEKTFYKANEIFFLLATLALVILKKILTFENQYSVNNVFRPS